MHVYVKFQFSMFNGKHCCARIWKEDNQFIFFLLITPSTWVITMEAMIDLVVEGY
jgi:hypothetical protein